MNKIEEKIDCFYQENEESVNVIIEGSDEHLDLILSITKPLTSITEKFKEFNEFLYSHISKYSDERLGKLMPKLRELNKSCITLIGAIRTCFLYQNVRTCLKEYSKQHDLLREIIHDIQYFRLNKDKEFDNLLNQLNEI